MTLSATILPYRGRIAPTPTGYLHLGHAATFLTAFKRAGAAQGALIYRNEDLDRARCQQRYADAAMEDLRWVGLTWNEGPDCGGEFGPYNQSERLNLYTDALERLKAGGHVYRCYCSRRDIQTSAQAPHQTDEEPIYAGTCRPKENGFRGSVENRPYCWRFRVPDGRPVQFEDEQNGRQEFVAGKDFGDFVVWTRDNIPSYQLAVVTDDALMRVTEVVRGADLLLSAARQILLYEALGWTPPRFYHCPLVMDENGERLAKRNDALSLRRLREDGATAASVLALIASKNARTGPGTTPPTVAE